MQLPDPNIIEKNNNNNKLANGKKGKKNKKSNNILNNNFGNLIPSGISKGINLIFVNPKFGNLMSGQSIQEENSIDYTDSDDENSVPKKKKVKGSPKKRKKNNKNKNKIQGQKQCNKIKNRPKYPKFKYGENDESFTIKENEDENNDDLSELTSKNIE